MPYLHYTPGLLIKCRQKLLHHIFLTFSVFLEKKTYANIKQRSTHDLGPNKAISKHGAQRIISVPAIG